jgi:hypothetical protein
MTFNIKPDSLAGYAHAFRPGSRWIVLGGMIDENGFVDDDASKA